MKGRRLADVFGRRPLPLPLDDLQPGDYWRHRHVPEYPGVWFAIPPEEGFSVANLTNHEVIEHDDATITVSPSIRVRHLDGEWHGWLERGEWRSV